MALVLQIIIDVAFVSRRNTLHPDTYHFVKDACPKPRTNMSFFDLEKLVMTSKPGHGEQMQRRNPTV